MLGATAEAVLQNSWQVVLEETLVGHQVQFFTYTEVAIRGLDEENGGLKAGFHGPVWTPSLYIHSDANIEKKQNY